MKRTSVEQLSQKEKRQISFQAVLKGIPYIGNSLEHLIFGTLNELRMRRIEDTLCEVSELLKKRSKPSTIESEEFANLLENVVPSLSRTIQDEKRKRFRDLLINALMLPGGSSEWEGATFASELLNEIDTPGIELIASIARRDRKGPNRQVLILEKEKATLYTKNPEFGEIIEDDNYELQYHSIVVEEWANRLAKLKLIDFVAPSRVAGRTSGPVTLTEKGQ